ncbi:unknown similar to AMEV120 [Mythimna separata entomopoxvirus 'L']|uniref:Uncharacterized protein n=1 Tax=Mythimna separata entomopoxvirus 'L' TaxID=1293572 RepID=A0A916KQ86_9POXV|nr:unknown similar to AMEV120 [Mythimna separata entomopoxvirus 'L']CCU56332.1 unknown similar to AMEV120 [Mythimna separata entomopoxvirus 'L']
MTETLKAAPSINLDDLYINAGNFSRKVKQVLNNIENKYRKDPEGTINYLNNLSAGAKSVQKRKLKGENNKNQVNELIGEYQMDSDVYCLKCKNKTGNMPASKVYNNGKNIRIECKCKDCGSKKSKFANKNFLNDNNIKKI